MNSRTAGSRRGFRFSLRLLSDPGWVDRPWADLPRHAASSHHPRHPVDDSGRTMHIPLYINGGSVMLGESYPEYGHPYEKPQGFSLVLQVDDIDSGFSRAQAAGCEVIMPVETMFWGDRYGQLRDPFGIVWGMNQPS